MVNSRPTLNDVTKSEMDVIMQRLQCIDTELSKMIQPCGFTHFFELFEILFTKSKKLKIISFDTMRKIILSLEPP